ncbi:unnamed protein product, partial [marine sediment metagenome]
MDKVFITHSRHDAPILTHITELVKTVGVEPILYQYEYMHTATAWQEIRDDIRRSHAVFVVLSNNLNSSAHTQNWVGWEVGVACAFNKRVWVFEELYRTVSFPIPYLTDYVAYELSNPQLRQLISAVARGYNLEPQLMSTVGVGGLGALFFGWPGLVIGAIIGNIVGKPEQAPYIDLMCYHLDCKTSFRMYVWLDELECPACRRTLRFRREEHKDGGSIIYPSPCPYELTYTHYVWYD